MVSSRELFSTGRRILISVTTALLIILYALTVYECVPVLCRYVYARTMISAFR